MSSTVKQDTPPEASRLHPRRLRWPSIAWKIRRHSVNTVPTLMTGDVTMISSSLYSSFDATHMPRTSHSTCRGRSLSTGMEIAKRKSALVLGFLSIKEPSRPALEQYRQEQRKKAEMIARQKGRRVNVAGLGGSTARMPEWVPKVNTKWDGLPTPRETRREKRGRPASSDGHRSFQSFQRSRAHGLPSAPSNSCASSEELDFLHRLSQGHRRPRDQSSSIGSNFKSLALSDCHQSAKTTSNSSLADLHSSLGLEPPAVDSSVGTTTQPWSLSTPNVHFCPAETGVPTSVSTVTIYPRC